MPALARRAALGLDFYTYEVLSVLEDGSDLRLEAFSLSSRPAWAGCPTGDCSWCPCATQDAAARARRRPRRPRRPSAHVTGHLNDMAVDSQGRAYVGNFGFDLMGGATHLDRAAPRRPRRHGDRGRHDLWFPNGSVITPEGVLLVDETFGNRVRAFDLDDDGRLGKRRTWAEFGPLPSRPALGETIPQIVAAPDGCWLDAEGGLWLADGTGGRVLRVPEGGEIVEEIWARPGVFACALGGADGRTLFLRCAPDFDEHARSAAREAELRAVRVDVPHAGTP